MSFVLLAAAFAPIDGVLSTVPSPLSFTYDPQFYTGDQRVPFSHPELRYEESTGERLRGVLLQSPKTGNGKGTFLVAAFSLSYSAPEEQVEAW